MASLKIGDVRTFACVADAGSFTAAGEVLGATQSAVSVRIQKLEALLGKRLLARTPRDVTLTADGANFLREARRLLDVHDDVVRRSTSDRSRVCMSIGISDHVAGVRLPTALATLSRALPEVRFHIEVGATDDLLQAFAQGAFDAAILRDPPADQKAATLFSEDLTWYAAEGFQPPSAGPLPIVALSHRCRVRDMSVETLDRSGIAWTEMFIGGSVAAVRAAVSAGLGIACLGRQNMPDSSRDVGAELELPAVSPSTFGMMRREASPAHGPIFDKIADAFRRIGSAESRS